jgi:hypothetical protein
MNRLEFFALVGLGLSTLGVTAGVILAYLTLKDRRDKNNGEGAEP